jgi:hypothetical protein
VNWLLCCCMSMVCPPGGPRVGYRARGWTSLLQAPVLELEQSKMADLAKPLFSGLNCLDV